MIHRFRQDREELLGRAPASQAPNLQAAPAPLPVGKGSQEPSAQDRLRSPLTYMGNSTAAQILPNFGVTFRELEADVQGRSGPLADIGASYSTLSFELAVRGVTCFPFDPTYDLSNPHMRRGLLQACKRLAPLYTESGKFTPGNEVAPMRSDCWSSYVEVVMKQLFRDMSKCFASALTFQDGAKVPNRFFSTVMSHQSLPKYLSTDKFLAEVLPELLRVADKRVILFPLVTGGPGNELVYLPGTPERERLDTILTARGFSLHLRQSPIFAEKVARGEYPQGYDLAGHFVRNGR
jgi:hypothetical protein